MAFYRKKALQEMTPWVEGLPIAVVSISEADRKNGSPKHGDMIAFNPLDATDMWLIAADYYKENYEWVSDL